MPSDGVMIKKTLLVLVSSLTVVLLAVGCTSSDTEQERALNQDSQQTAAALKGDAFNATTLSKEALAKQVADSLAQTNLYDSRKDYGSIWNSDLFNDDRFQMNIKLKPNEQKEAKVLARSFEKHMERSKMFMHYLLTELKERNLPLELAAVPLVESGFNPRAKSHAGAHGPWQFTRQTGKSFGLEVNANYDEFYDFVASTDASLTYLEHLYRAFDKNWELALIAYNQGEFGVKRAIRRAKSAGVKNIVPENLKLSKTARTYLVRFRAYADILHHPEAYGLEHPKIENRVAFKRVQVAGKVNSMREAAKLAGVDLKTLKHLNAGYLTDSLAGNKNHGLLVPIDNVRRLERALGIAPVNPAEHAQELSGVIIKANNMTISTPIRTAPSHVTITANSDN